MKKRARPCSPSRSTLPGPILTALFHADIVIGCIAPLLSLVEKSKLACVCSRLYTIFSTRSESYKLICDLYKMKHVMPRYKRNILLTSRLMDCILYVYGKEDNKREVVWKCLKMASQNGDEKTLYFACGEMREQRTDQWNGIYEATCLNLVSNGHVSLSITVITNENNMWWNAEDYKTRTTGLSKLWECAIRFNKLDMEHALRAKLLLFKNKEENLNRRAVVLSMSNNPWNAATFDFFWDKLIDRIGYGLTIMNNLIQNGIYNRHHAIDVKTVVEHIQSRISNLDKTIVMQKYQHVERPNIMPFFLGGGMQ